MFHFSHHSDHNRYHNRKHLRHHNSKINALTFLWCVLAILLSSQTALAASRDSEMVIFDVRKSLPLDPKEVVYKDFYITLEGGNSLRKAQIVSVVREVPVHDPIQNKQQATMSIVIARLKILHVDKGIAVARLAAEIPSEERPTVEYEGVMIGDRIDPRSDLGASLDPGTETQPGNTSEQPLETAKLNIGVALPP